MNRSRLLLIGAMAFAVGLLVSVNVYKRLNNPSNQEPSVQVVVAANDIRVGTKLADSDVRLLAFPQSMVPPEAIKRKSEALNHGVILPIFKGEFILPVKLAGENAGSGLPSMIPPGMRAVSVRVTDTGFIEPGTRVDVMATGSSGNDRQTTTVLENVLVIAVGRKLDRATAGEGGQTAAPSPVITLLVSPDDAQKLALVSQEGRIQLALRNPLDTKMAAVPATKATSIYPNGRPPATGTTEPKPKVRKPAVKVPVALPQPYAVEIIRGSKRDETKLGNEH